MNIQIEVNKMIKKNIYCPYAFREHRDLVMKL